MKAYTRIGDQFELFPRSVMRSLEVPWGGRSPRGLTRGALGVILKTQGEKSVIDFVNPEQGDLWVPKKTVLPHLWGGTPSLLPLLEVNDG